MKSLVGGVFLLLFVLLNVMCCEGCWKQERDALNAMSWSANTNIDCCEWEGVECNTTTGRVTKLNLHGSSNKSINYSDFAIFKDLKNLTLSASGISNCTRTDQGLNNLEVLDLSHNMLDNAISILSCLDGFSSLKSLSLAYISDLVSFHDFQTVMETISSKLRHLEVLDISGNYKLTNEIMPSLRGFTSLKELSLSYIGLDSNLHIQGLCTSLKNLEILDISRSYFSDTDIASALSGLSSLKSLNLAHNALTMISIHNISKLRSLEILDLSLNYMDSLLLENHGFGFAWPSSLQVLSLSDNGLSNNILSQLSGLPHLKSLNLSSNNLNGSLDISGLSNLTSLKILDFSENQIVDLVVREGSKNLSRLEILDLDWNMINGSNLQEWLPAFRSIRNLTLRYNEFKGTILDGGFRDLRNLEYLALDGSSNLKNEFFKSIGDLPSLKVLSASGCEINGTLPIGDWSKLKNLEELDLFNNEFVGKLPSSFVNMTSLRSLTLANNHFTGNIGLNLASLTSLEYLNFEGNQFEFPISFTQFSNHSNLKFIYGNGNKVIHDSHTTMKTWVPKFQLKLLQLSSTTKANSIPLPNFLFYQYNLTYVDFTGCKLSGEFPNWLLENNTKMEMLILQNCSFMGDFHLPSRPHLSMATIDVSNNAITGFHLPSYPHLNMAKIDVSNNAITGQMLSNNISSIFPNLVHLNMSKNAIHGSIPRELSHFSSLQELDISNNQLSGKIPYNLTSDGNQLTFLRLSNNNLHGPIPPLLSMNSLLQYLLLDGNSLSGTIPIHFFNSSTIQNVDISNNNFIGNIPSQINCTRLSEISMSNNHFEGSIPIELAELESIIYLDLSQNNLSGCVPSFVHSLANFIHLNNNSLSCLSKNMFSEISPLVALDLSNNEIIYGIHDLIHDLRYITLQILLLKGNHFTGNIPKQLCQLKNLNILDLSCNNFFGEIPNCLGNMPFENNDLDESRGPFYRVFQGSAYLYRRFRKEKENFTSKNRTEIYTTNILMSMSGIDLSQNKLNGSIPYEFGNLTKIRSLNLSNNFFTGKIPETFSSLVQVESLDLSLNMLSGQIPPQLSGLTSLEVFSVAYNNLSGATPEWKGQFSTFDESSYKGNQFLCGPPLPNSCNPSEEGPTTLPNGFNNDGDDDSWVDMYVFRVSFVVAYTSIVLVIPTVLYINPYWRQAWFYYIGLVCMNCYYFIQDNLYKFF